MNTITKIAVALCALTALGNAVANPRLRTMLTTAGIVSLTGYVIHKAVNQPKKTELSQFTKKHNFVCPPNPCEEEITFFIPDYLLERLHELTDAQRAELANTMNRDYNTQSTCDNKQ